MRVFIIEKFPLHYFYIQAAFFFKGRFKRSRKMLIDHQYEMYVLICLFESGLFKVDTRFCSSQHVHVLYICS